MEGASTAMLASESDEVTSNFMLERLPLCRPAFLSERMQQRLRRRLKRSGELPKPLVLRQLLTEEECSQVYSFVAELRAGFESGAVAAPPADSVLHSDGDELSEEEDKLAPALGEAPEPGSAEWLAEQMRLTAQLNPANYEAQSNEGDFDEPDVEAAWVRCSAEHEKLFLHCDVACRRACGQTFAEACPDLLNKLLDTMRTSTLLDGRPLPCELGPLLNVRCIEFHDYKAGGGLQDPGHIDVGSTLTLSVQLSEPGPDEFGGRFTTTGADGIVVTHELARGDAICFCSEAVHNVSTLQKGTRNSMVIELWTDPANMVDRHH